MLNDAGPEQTLEIVDGRMYWKGRVYIEAARMAHEQEEDPTKFTMTWESIEPYVKDAEELLAAELADRDNVSKPMPNAVFEEGQELSPRYVVLLAASIDAARKSGLNITIMPEKHTVKLLGILGTPLAQSLIDEITERTGAVKEPTFRDLGMGFECAGPVETNALSPLERKNMLLGKKQFQQRQRVGRNSQQRWAKPQRQNFKGRGR